MSFFDGLNDGDRQEIGWHGGADIDTFNVIRHQHREHAAVQRQVEQHGAGYAPPHAQSYAQTSSAPNGTPSVSGEQTGDGFARCEVLVPKTAPLVKGGGRKETEPSRRLREAMGLCRKRRQKGGLGLGQSRPVGGSSYAPPPCQPPPAALLGS